MSEDTSNRGSGCTFYPVAASVVWKDKTSNVITTRGFSFVVDEPKEDGGNDLGPTPAEVLLWSAAGCVAISVEEILIHRKITFTELKCESAGMFMSAEEGIRNLRFTVHVKTEAEQEVLDKIGEKVLRVSPILNSLKTPATIKMVRS